MIFQKLINYEKLAKASLLLIAVINSYLMASEEQDRIYLYRRPNVTRENIFKVDEGKYTINKDLIDSCYKSGLHRIRNDPPNKPLNCTQKDICESFEQCIQAACEFGVFQGRQDLTRKMDLKKQLENIEKMVIQVSTTVEKNKYLEDQRTQLTLEKARLQAEYEQLQNKHNSRHEKPGWFSYTFKCFCNLTKATKFLLIIASLTVIASSAYGGYSGIRAYLHN